MTSAKLSFKHSPGHSLSTTCTLVLRELFTAQPSPSCRQAGEFRWAAKDLVESYLFHPVLGDMSGAQPKAAKIAGCISVVAEMNEKATRKRHEQGWVNAGLTFEESMKIARAFNEAIRKNVIGPVVLGRDHHDVSGTDSPYRETSNIYDGSQFTADMAVHNVIGDSFRGATWVSIHNGGGVGWGEAINGGFGMVLDGSNACDENIMNMLHFDVFNGLARGAWAHNKNADFAVERGMSVSKSLHITLPNAVNDNLLETAMR